MSKSWEQMYSLADYLFQTSQNELTQLINNKSKDIKQSNNKSIDDKLLELIIEEKCKTNKLKNLISGSFVLKKLVAKENLNHFVINLFVGNDGYSVGLKLNDSENLIETMRLPYDENQLLEYIDNEQLPPLLVDLIENSPLINSNLFQSGCLIVEVRDYRRSANTHSHYCSSNWVLLRPTTQSLTNDVINIINNSSNEYLWTNEAKAELESQLILATSPPLCLDPNPAVAILSNMLLRKRQMFRTNTFSKLAKRCSQITANRVKKFELMAGPKSLRLHEFLKKRNTNSNSQKKLNKMIHYNMSEPTVESIPAKKIGVEKFAKELSKPQITYDNSLVKIEEYIMDFMDDNRRSLTNVTILHRPNDDTYFGQLYIDKQGQIRGSTCTFQLGTKQATKRYIDQFTEILTENGRKSVKIIHQIPGQVPQVSYTPAATATGMTTSATKDPLEDEGMNLGTTTPKKCKLTAIEQSPPISSPVLIHSPIISPTSSTSVTPKPMETLSLPAVFSPQSKATSDSSSPLLTSGIHATTGSTTISESALAVILTPSTGIAKSLQQIDTTSLDTTHQTITSTPLPTGVSLTSLSLAPVQQNLRLHNLVSLTPQGLAVPISLTMMSTPSGQQSSIMTTPGSMIVSLDQTQQKDDENVTVTYAATPTTVLMSTGTAGNNVLSVPIGMAGSLGVHQLNARFINQLNQSSGQIRATSPQVSLLQMSNTSTVQLRPLAPAPHTYSSTLSSTTFSQIQTSNTHPIQTLTPQQQLTNALRRQQVQIAPQKPQRKRQPKKSS